MTVMIFHVVIIQIIVMICFNPIMYTYIYLGTRIINESQYTILLMFLLAV